MSRESKFMEEAIRLSRKGMIDNAGGPFGCVVVRGDEIIGRGYNQVILQKDPTAHAEIVAIRDACNTLGSFKLTDCEIYASCEPCPMCLGAIYWARPKAIYYANNNEDAAAIGFEDSLIYEEMNKKLAERKIPTLQIGREEALKIFEEWENKSDKVSY